MAQPVIQHSFHAGEWAPALNARVDLAKYHSAARLLKNFFVDYRGGASTRFGTKYILHCFNSDTSVPIRLIPFNVSFTLNYVIEAGPGYFRFYANGAPILEGTKNITAATKANPCQITVPGHSYSPGDWIYITGVNGMTQLNGKYYIVAAVAGNILTLDNLDLVPINSTGYGVYTSGGTTQRVYTLITPYTAFETPLLKYAQDVNVMILCHPNHPPYVLTYNNPTSWTISAITFVASVAPPSPVNVTTTLAAGAVNYAYVVTTVNVLGEESGPSNFAPLANVQDLRTVAGTNTVSWTAAANAVSYNVYKAQVRYGAAVPAGSQFGFIGNVTGTDLIDSNISPDFSQTPPVSRNPFFGTGVVTITMTAGGSYTTLPSVTIAPGGPGTTAVGQCVMQAATIAVNVAGEDYAVGDTVVLPFGVSIQVSAIDGSGGIVSFVVISYGTSTTQLPQNPVHPIATEGDGLGATFNLTWSVGAVALSNVGSGYGIAQPITFSPAGATATMTVNGGATEITFGNPTVPGYFQQRLVLAGPPGNTQQLNMSQPGSSYNFNVSEPLQGDDAIEATLKSGTVNKIQSLISMPGGLIVLCDKQAFQVKGSDGAITPINIDSDSQAYNGSSDVIPLVINYDILYVQAKGSIVRDLTYNFYTNIYTGTDISVLSSHLFFGYTITGWAYAEEPYKLVWATRNDGVLLSLTFVKEQELIGWTHHDTQGLWQSVASVTETVQQGTVDGVYLIAQRSINNRQVRYVERMADRFLPNSDQSNAWCVDSALQYNGPATSVLSGLDHLIGATVTGVANGVEITPRVVDANGQITLDEPTTFAVAGLAFTPQLQTLAIDLGEPTVQSKRKKIPTVTVRCQDTLGLSIGQTFDTLVAMKDLVVGNVGSCTNERVTRLVTGDARTNIDPNWTEPGQYCIQQSKPFPATILGVIPEITIGDTPK